MQLSVLGKEDLRPGASLTPLGVGGEPFSCHLYNALFVQRRRGAAFKQFEETLVCPDHSPGGGNDAHQRVQPFGSRLLTVNTWLRKTPRGRGQRTSGKPEPNQIPTPPDSAGLSKASPDIKVALKCENRTQRDAIKRNHAAWHNAA